MTFPGAASPEKYLESKHSSAAWNSRIVRRIRSMLIGGVAPRHVGVRDCVADAVGSFTDLRKAGVPPGEVWVAVGRLAYAGKRLDHAWIVSREASAWWVHDPSGLRSCATSRGQEVVEYRPMAYLDEDRLLLRDRRLSLATLRPVFFLDVHLGVVARALASIFDASEIAAMNAMNWQADMNGYDPREHCDNGALLESLRLAEDRLAWKDGKTPRGTVVDAPMEVAYGLAFHTIADFYAHTNFVPVSAAFYGGLAQAQAFDLALRDTGFLDFLKSDAWSNEMLWHAPKPYSCKPFEFPDSSLHALVSGAFPQKPGHPNDGWYGRPDLPIHDHFAIDQPDSGFVHEDPIVPRQHPFAFPYVWQPHFASRERLATEHLRRVAQRLKAGDTNPLMGTDLEPPPDGLFLAEWELQDGQPLGETPEPRRDKKGQPIQPWGSGPRAKAKKT